MRGDVELPEAVELQGPGQAVELAAAAEAALVHEPAESL